MPNQLQYESSLYLRQHANNPVNWYPWCDEAFEIAAQDDKPVLVSIGYAACHWCHVMEKESFEDNDVAAFMNEHFVCIKVDREEHPDVDHLYMDALQAMTGAGGWPLNIFVTPDRKPFYGGTYFPPQSRYGRASWIEVLKALQTAWKSKKEEIALQADQLIAHLKQAAHIETGGTEDGLITGDTIQTITLNLLQQADPTYGGFGGAPKFPATGAIRFLLEYNHYNKDSAKADLVVKAGKHALLSIDKMLAGGIYDQLGGGFARYATDKAWIVPHFEKMLYDNALLISLLADAYRLTRKEKYMQAIKETIDFCKRDLRGIDHPGFYSALDADSEGEEGRFYTWTWDQWNQIINDGYPALTDYYGLEEEGNWEHTNILFQAVSAEEVQKRYHLSEQEWTMLLAEAKRKLFAKREERTKPATDDKVLLSWNALMNKALTDSAIALDDEQYLKEAEVHMQWLLNVFKADDGGYYHVYINGESRIEGKLDDYAYLAEALLMLASATGKTKYILQACTIVEYVCRYFLDDHQRFFYFSSSQQQDILIRKLDTYDGATPSANAVMMEQIRILGNLMERNDWISLSQQMLYTMSKAAVRYPTSFSYWTVYMQRYVKGYKQLVITGANAHYLRREWWQKYAPEYYMILGNEYEGIKSLKNKYHKDQTLLYICSDFSCLPPVSTIDELDI